MAVLIIPVLVCSLAVKTNDDSFTVICHGILSFSLKQKHL